MDYEALARNMYHAYGEVTDFKNYQGLPMPAWEELTPKIQTAWTAAARHAAETCGVQAEAVTEELKLDGREVAQIQHALDYAANYSGAGATGHGQLLLIAKLAKALGFAHG